ncbi:plasmid pRiA4b ORF-3 family protein [Bacillus cereus]
MKKDVCQLCMILEWISPEIWRRVVVPKDLSFNDLHNVIQCLFQWDNMHLYEFRLGNVEISPQLEDPFGGGDVFLSNKKKVVDASKESIKNYVEQNKVFHYTYDFGDDWNIRIQVEEMEEDPHGPKLGCIGGERNAPPEDIGGVPGYMDFLEAIQDSKHPMYSIYEEDGLLGFDAEYFNMDDINQELLGE